MLTIIPLWFLVFLYTHRLRLIKHPAFWFNVLAAQIILLLSYLESALLTPFSPFIRFDEQFFFEEATQPLSYIFDRHLRYLSYIVFTHLTYISAGAWAIKAQLVPFAVLIVLTLYDATRRKLTLWLFPIFFGYFYMLATLNMRDPILIWAMLFFLLQVSRSGIAGIIIWSGVAMAFFAIIRPEFSVIWLFLMLWFVTERWLKRGVLVSYILPAIFVLGLFIGFERPILQVVDYFYPGRTEIYLSERSEELGRLPLLNENAAALVRQLITPLPTSKIQQLLTTGPTANLVLKEVFRIILMSSVYSMIVILVLFAPKAYRCFDNNPFYQALFVFSIINAMAYVVYGDGGGATRNKVYPFLLIYGLFTHLVVLKMPTQDQETQPVLRSSGLQRSSML